MGAARHDISPDLLACVRASFAEHACVQEAHGTIAHAPCELVELALFPGPAAT